MKKQQLQKIKIELEALYNKYNQFSFIEKDPISIPHQFTQKQDIEISGLFAAVLAWGQRTTILNNCNSLLQRMDFRPYDFVCNHKDSDLRQLKGFVHRTFNEDDLLYFIEFLNFWYKENDSLESAFTSGLNPEDSNVYNGLIAFRNHFFGLEHLKRTEKHISSPLKNSACKRLNLYLRWMVRKDKLGVDFGIWNQIKTSQLIMPLDVHVLRIALEFKLIDREKADWTTAEMLTNKLKALDPVDPVKYDFALFGYGVSRKIENEGM